MVTPPIEENIVRVSISNELVKSTLQDEELQGLLTIPNDDLDYLDYVEAITEGGDTEGPFTAVQLDFTQLIIDPVINLYTRYSYLSTSISDSRSAQNSLSLSDVIFTIKSGTENVNLANNKAIIKIAPYNSDGYFKVSYVINQTGSTQSIYVINQERYAIINTGSTLLPYFHYCSTTANEDLGEIIVQDPSSYDGQNTVCFVKNTFYRIFIQVSE